MIINDLQAEIKTLRKAISRLNNRHSKQMATVERKLNKLKEQHKMEIKKANGDYAFSSVLPVPQASPEPHSGHLSPSTTTPTSAPSTADRQVIHNLLEAFTKVIGSAQQNMHKYEQQDQASHASPTMKYMVLHPIRHEVVRAYEQATMIYNDLPPSFFYTNEQPDPSATVDKMLTQIDKFLISTSTME